MTSMFQASISAGVAGRPIPSRAGACAEIAVAEGPERGLPAEDDRERDDAVGQVVDHADHAFVEELGLVDRQHLGVGTDELRHLLAQLPLRLQTLKSTAKDPKVIINSDGSADFKHVVAVLDEVRDVAPDLERELAGGNEDEDPDGMAGR